MGLGQNQQQNPAVHTWELAGRGSVAGAVGVSGRLRTGDKLSIVER